MAGSVFYPLPPLSHFLLRWPRGAHTQSFLHHHQPSAPPNQRAPRAPLTGAVAPWQSTQAVQQVWPRFMPQGLLTFVDKNPGSLCTGNSTGAYDFNAEVEWCVPIAHTASPPPTIPTAARRRPRPAPTLPLAPPPPAAGTPVRHDAAGAIAPPLRELRRAAHSYVDFHATAPHQAL